jgi:hypothetical protein
MSRDDKDLEFPWTGPRPSPLGDSEDEVMEATGYTYRDDPEAIAFWLEDYLETHPASVRIRLQLGSIYADGWGQGVAGAERVFKDALALDPGNLTAMVRLALLQGHPHSSLSVEESLGLLDRAVTLSGDPHILRNYANKAWEGGQIDRAVAAFERLKAIATGSSAPFFARVAEQSLDAIRRGEHPNDFVYWYPDII